MSTEGIHGGGALPDYNTGVENSVVSTFKTLKSQGMTDDEAIKFMESTLSTSELAVLKSLGEEIPNEPGKPVLRKALANLLAVANKDIQLGKNPWLNPTFMAAFGEVMMDIVRIKSQMRFQEAKAAMTGMLMQLQAQLAAAGLTRASAEADAAMKTTEATFAFVQAGISAAGGLCSLGTRALATRNVNSRELQLNKNLEKFEAKAAIKHDAALARIDNKMQAHQDDRVRNHQKPADYNTNPQSKLAHDQKMAVWNQKFDRLSEEKQKLMDNSPIPKKDGTGLPNRTNAADNPQRKAVLDNLNDKDKAAYLQAHGEYAYMHDPGSRQQLIHTEMQALEAQRNATFQSLGHIADGSGKLALAPQIIKKGEIDAKSQEMQAFAKVFDHLERNAAQGMQTAASDIDAIIRAFEGILAANSRAHALGRG